MFFFFLQDSWGKVVISMDSIHRSMLPGDGLYVEGDDASVYSTDEGRECRHVVGCKCNVL